MHSMRPITQTETHTTHPHCNLSQPPTEHTEPREISSPDFNDLISFLEWAAQRRDTLLPRQRDTLLTPLLLLLDAAAEFYGAVTVGDALQTNLAHLARTIGTIGDLNSTAISDITNSHRIVDTICDQLATKLATMSPLRLWLLENRLVANNPPTIEEVARELGISREAVRKNQLRVATLIDEAVGFEVGAVSALVAERLGPVATSSDLEETISRIVPDDRPAAVLAQFVLKSRLNYSCVDGICLNPDAVGITKDLRASASKLADDAGLIDEDALRDSLPSDEWAEFFPQLLFRCGFTRLSGQLAWRDTSKARTKAALVHLGRVATKEEIAEIVGLEPSRVSGYLSGLDSVARADKTRWGLVEWIDDVYEGIPAEIIQRINEDGGTTKFERLIEELPRLFEVSESSVRAYVATPQFILNDGHVSLADISSIKLRALDDVIDGRDTRDNPYWTFKVESRYFQGFSLTGFPPELAKELGCEPNGKAAAYVANPLGCRNLSVNWRLTSMAGASLGNLGEPLRRLDATAGDRVRVTIKAPGVVALYKTHTLSAPEEAAATSGKSLLERMKSRRRVV